MTLDVGYELIFLIYNFVVLNIDVIRFCFKDYMDILSNLFMLFSFDFIKNLFISRQ